MTRFSATENDAKKRLDVFVAKQLPQLSRTFVKRLCDDAKIIVNNRPEKVSYRLQPGDKVIVEFDLKKLEQIPYIDLPVLYEDDDCIVINKPAGVLSHSKGAFNPEATVATFIKDKLTDLDGERGGIVHRLDRTTSGVMISSKNPAALAWLQKQFSQRKVKKTYYAVVDGHLEPPEAVIEMPIERHPRVPKTFRTSLSGKPAVTEYRVVQSGGNYDLVELRPQTGRTHQLRVHLKQVGHPIVGDTLYDGKPADRLYLHAVKLELTLPNRQRKIFECPLPSNFRTMIERDGKDIIASTD